MLIFEPHNGFSAKNPDGEPWPYGYISEADTPTSIPSPIFELSPVLGTPELWAKTVIRMAAADDLLLAVKCLCEEMADYMAINNLGDPNEKHNYRLGMAAIAKAEGEMP